MRDLIRKAGGKKFVMALFTLISVMLMSFTGFDLEPLKEIIIGVAGSFLVGQGVADGLSKGATSSQAESVEIKASDADMPDLSGVR